MSCHTYLLPANGVLWSRQQKETAVEICGGGRWQLQMASSQVRLLFTVRLLCLFAGLVRIRVEVRFFSLLTRAVEIHV